MPADDATPCDGSASAESVAVVIVSHEHPDDLAGCLESLRGVVPPGAVFVVDNASGEETLQVARMAGVHVLPQERNLGFGRACNLGIVAARRSGHRHVLLLNQDTRIEALDLRAMLQAALAGGFGVLSPLQLDARGRGLEAGFAGHLARAGLPVALPALLTGPHTIAVPYVNAAAWLVTDTCLRRVGGFDPAFFLYCEDDDYLERVHHHGLGVGVLPSARVRHLRTRSRYLLAGLPLTELARRQALRYFCHLKSPRGAWAERVLGCGRVVAGDVMRGGGLGRRGRLAALAGALAVLPRVPLAWRRRALARRGRPLWLDDARAG